MIPKLITDEEFIGSFLNFNRRARPSISLILEEALIDESKCRDGDM